MSRWDFILIIGGKHMNIVDARSEKCVKFFTLKNGDTFLYKNRLYVKINELKSEYKSSINAILFSKDGSIAICNFSNEDKVTPVKCTITIEE